MKFRTDFVTNSSSSSFVAVLRATLDNGEKLTASASFDYGEGDTIVDPIVAYEMETDQIRSLDKFSQKSIMVDGESRYIQSGTLKLMSHAYGEEVFKSGPQYLLKEYFGEPWEDLFEQMSSFASLKLSEQEQFQKLRADPFLQKYTDKSLKGFVRFYQQYINLDDDDSDTEIIQTLSPDGMLDIEIKQGEDLFRVVDIFDYPRRRNYQKGKLVIGRKTSTRQKNVRKDVAEKEKEKQHIREEKLKYRLEQERIRIAERELYLKYKQEKKAAEREQKLKYEQEKKKEREARENERKRMQALAAEEAAEKERQRRESIANVLYKPGNEPENIRRRIDVLFPKLNAAYPNKQIIALYKDHKKWGETVTELYRLLGYPDGKAFLEAYGYTVADNKGGRPSNNNYDEVILELHRRYPNGSRLKSVNALKEANPDLPIKSLVNSSKALYGMSLGEYLKKEGILS